MSDEKRKNDGAEFIEELRVAGDKAVEQVKNLIQQGNVRRLIVRKPNGEAIVDFPLTPTVIGAGAMLIFAPLLSLLAGVVAYLAEVKIEVVRALPDEEAGTDDLEEKKKRIEIE